MAVCCLVPALLTWGAGERSVVADMEREKGGMEKEDPKRRQKLSKAYKKRDLERDT